MPATGETGKNGKSGAADQPVAQLSKRRRINHPAVSCERVRLRQALKGHGFSSAATFLSSLGL